MNEYIIFVKLLKNKRLVIGRMKLSGIKELNKIGLNGQSWKIIHLEFRKNIRSAEMRENKLKSLTRTRLLEEIRKSNPELLDLKHTIISRNFFEELIY
ncbi:MAG TPA: hypothetical protein VGK25_01665 [Ignavibacteria bacterium]|jgi:hypothetical protein